MEEQAASDEKASRSPKSEPNENADNEGEGGTGDQTEGADDGGSTDYGAGGDNTIYVLNSADEDICYLYLALDGDWSDDVLGVYALPMDYFYWVTGVPSGEISVYAEGCEGSTWYGSDDVDGDYTFILTGGGGDDGGDDSGGGGEESG